MSQNDWDVAAVSGFRQNPLFFPFYLSVRLLSSAKGDLNGDSLPLGGSHQRTATVLSAGLGEE